MPDFLSLTNFLVAAFQEVAVYQSRKAIIRMTPVIVYGQVVLLE